MKIKLLSTLIAGTALLCTTSSHAAVTLTQGDIAIIGFMGDSPDEFSWVNLVDLSAGTEIYFTDSGYSSSSTTYQGSGNASEWLIKYTVPAGGLTAGTVLTVVDNNTVPTNYTQYTGTEFGDRDVSASGINLNQSAGDSITAFQSIGVPGTADFTNNVTAIFSLDTADTPFTFNFGATSTTTDVPSGLTDGVNAVSAPNDNTRYTGTTTGTRNELLAAITNDANWVGQDATPASGWSNASGTNFTVIPEPSSLSLLGIGILTLAARRRRQ